MLNEPIDICNFILTLLIGGFCLLLIANLFEIIKFKFPNIFTIILSITICVFLIITIFISFSLEKYISAAIYIFLTSLQGVLAYKQIKKFRKK